MVELRRPKPAYQGRNGFAESVTAPANGVVSESAKLKEEVKKRRLVEWVLKEKGTYFPSLEEIRRSNAEPETTSTVRRRIDELKTQHAKDMETLYTYYAQVYRQEQMDLRRSRDDCTSHEQDDFTVALDELYRKSRLPMKIQLEWDDAASRIRYSHLQTLLPLQKKLTTLSSQFPDSLEGYHAMHNNQDMQLKVARFLTAGNMRDAMLSDFGWAWRQVKPLIDIYDRDADFKAEVQRYVKDNEVRDPRKRSSISKGM